MCEWALCEHVLWVNNALHGQSFGHNSSTFNSCTTGLSMIVLDLCVVLFIFLLENLEELSTVPRPLALTGITVHKKNQLHQTKSCTNGSETITTLEILILGQVHTLE